MLDDPAEVLRVELADGERLLWAGRARQGLMLRWVDALLIPFSLVWGGFAIFWEASVIRGGAPPGFALFGIPFVAIGVYLIFGRFFVDAWQRARTIYGVTSERVVIRSGILQRQTKSLPLATLNDVSLTERGSGAGTISFGSHWIMSSWTIPGWPGWGPPIPMFELAADARHVYETIRGAQRKRD